MSFVLITIINMEENVDNLVPYRDLFDVYLLICRHLFCSTFYSGYYIQIGLLCQIKNVVACMCRTQFETSFLIGLHNVVRSNIERSKSEIRSRRFFTHEYPEMFKMRSQCETQMWDRLKAHNYWLFRRVVLLNITTYNTIHNDVVFKSWWSLISSD